MKFRDKYQVTAQYSETSSDSDSSSYACEETRTPSNMGNEQPMEVIVLPRGDDDSGATIPAETVLDSTTADDWKVSLTGSMQKLEDQFDKEVHTPIVKQPTTVKKKSTATPPQVIATVKVIHQDDHNVDLLSIYDVDNIDVSNNQTITTVNNSTYHPPSEELHMKPPATTKKQDVVLEDIDIHVFNNKDNSAVQQNEEDGHPKVMEVAVVKQPSHIAMESKLVTSNHYGNGES